MNAFLAPPFDQKLMAALLRLNNAHAEELSYKTEQGFGDLLAAAAHVRAAPQGLALLVCFDETGDYDSPNFLWLKARFPRFLYIDRVVVDAAARGRGLARALYDEAAAVAKAQGRERLVCEVNLDPPNAASDAFHERLGFRPIGEQRFGDGKVVRYWEKAV